MNRRSGSPERYDVYGKFITKGGELSSPFTISVRGNPSARFNPMDILFDGADYLVVWNRDTGPGYPSSSMWDIYGRKVSPDGSLGPEVPLVTSPGDQVVPTVLFDGTNYFSTWNDGKTGVVVGRLFNTSLSPVGSEFILFESTDAKVPMGGLTLFDGTRYLALVTMLKYTDKYTLDVYGRFIYTGADPYDPNGVGGTTMADVLICYKQYLGIPMSIDYPLADVDGGGVTMRDVLKIYKRYLGLS